MSQEGRDSKSGRFLPGHSYATGRPKVTSKMRFLREELQDCIHEALTSDITYFDRVKNDPTSTVLRIMVARHVYEALKGSIPHWDKVLDRAIGPVPKEYLAGESDAPKIVEFIPKEKLVQIITEHYDNRRSAVK